MLSPQIYLIPFILSLICTAFIVILAQQKQWFLSKNDLEGVQKFHHHPTPHIGSLAVFTGFTAGYFLLIDSQVVLALLLASLPLFIAGLTEDLSAKTSPIWRLLSVFFSISISFFYLEIGIFTLGFEWTDNLLAYPVIGWIFTLLVVGGAVNALNVIDGYNGLMPGYMLLALMAIGVVAYGLDDVLIMQLSTLLGVSILGFFLLNFPLGKIFIGDAGAYFCGFMLAMIGLLLVDRNKELSNWFVLLVLIYPMYELLFSVYRKKLITKTLITRPDGYHLHMLIHQKLLKHKMCKTEKMRSNNMTSPFLWVLSLVGIIPAIIWYNNQTMLIIWALIFMVVYTIIYWRIVQFGKQEG
ncbi:Undecaprenyl-phosphate N-acetylglucosaminyl 1-phosphate transferase [uncultured Candidatus Thioglobus sp.]|nr:Undecaprenyl-phosphate N-acetylglucosaminyl 1-phosphate transferase [uncultured Candidatus Thioglobus sp.]